MFEAIEDITNVFPVIQFSYKRNKYIRSLQFKKISCIRRRQKEGKQGRLFNAITNDSGRNAGIVLVKRPEKISRSIAAALWFTDLNTLEFILLGCGIIVCLAGIMFQSSATDHRALVQEQVDAVTYIVLIVIITSIVYYVLFFLAEVSPRMMSRCLELCRETNNDKQEEFYDPNINLQENPMFAAPKVEFADNKELQQELDQQLAQLKFAEQQNKRLRDELKQRKMEAQFEETSRQKNTGYESVKPKKERKDFAQTRLTAALIGPNRQRARGGKKADENYEKEEVLEDDLEAALPSSDPSKRKSVFQRLSIAVGKKKNQVEEEDD